jgi:hypothetical protein
MTRKIITGVIAAVLVVTIAVFAAEKVKEKATVEKARAGEQIMQHERLLDQLAEAYKANDRQKMGEIIDKMQERREKMREFVKLNRWHKWAHRRMMRQMEFGWGQGQQMAGQGWNRGWAMQGRGPNKGCPMAGPRWGQGQAMRGCGPGACGGMGNCGSMAGGGFGQMPCQQGGPMQMRGCGRGFQREWTPGPGADNMGQQNWNVPRRERMNVPPADWGW